MNFDAYVPTNAICCLGVVFCDREGRILVADVRRVKAGWPAVVSEAATALFGLQVAARHGFECVHMEGDSLSVIAAVESNVEGSSPLHLLYEHILLLSRNFLIVVALLRDMGIR